MNYDGRFLNLAIAYGGRGEILDAVREIASKVASGELAAEEINEDVFERHLYTGELPNPEPDLVIRTSGEARLSNFLLWQSAYSELVFQDVHFPDFRMIDFMRAVRTYQQRVRRFGL
jgi:tritrans,polycis-undecaprenyl-diphosphate synthase [geranylgeranyl-diphosphate specific]